MPGKVLALDHDMVVSIGGFPDECPSDVQDGNGFFNPEYKNTGYEFTDSQDNVQMVLPDFVLNGFIQPCYIHGVDIFRLLIAMCTAGNIPVVNASDRIRNGEGMELYRGAINKKYEILLGAERDELREDIATALANIIASESSSKSDMVVALKDRQWAFQYDAVLLVDDNIDRLEGVSEDEKLRVDRLLDDANDWPIRVMQKLWKGQEDTMYALLQQLAIQDDKHKIAAIKVLRKMSSDQAYMKGAKSALAKIDPKESWVSKAWSFISYPFNAKRHHGFWAHFGWGLVATGIAILALGVIAAAVAAVVVSHGTFLGALAVGAKVMSTAGSTIATGVGLGSSTVAATTAITATSVLGVAAVNAAVAGTIASKEAPKQGVTTLYQKPVGQAAAGVGAGQAVRPQGGDTTVVLNAVLSTFRESEEAKTALSNIDRGAVESILATDNGRADQEKYCDLLVLLYLFYQNCGLRVGAGTHDDAEVNYGFLVGFFSQAATQFSHSYGQDGALDVFLFAEESTVLSDFAETMKSAFDFSKVSPKFQDRIEHKSEDKGAEICGFVSRDLPLLKPGGK